MLYYRLILPHELYSNLKTIENVKISQREIDIVACILNGRSAKGIANFLSISPKTVEAHTYNLMKKLGCSSRESMISLIEKSEQFLILKKHYLSLLLYASFKEALKEIGNINKQSLACSIVCWREEKESRSLVPYLKAHLELIGIKVFLDMREEQEPISRLIEEPHREGYKIYILPNELIKENNERIEAYQPAEISASFNNNILFVLCGNAGANDCPLDLHAKFVLFGEDSNYYLLFIDILKNGFSDIPVNSIFSKFEEKYHALQDSTTTQPRPSNQEEENSKQEKILASYLTGGVLKKRKWSFLLLSVVAVFCLYFLTYYPIKKDPEKSIRSDLILPSESSLLPRPEFMTEIDNKLKGQEGIQTVALVGMGGAGKTTLARAYAHSQGSSIIWEINAETKESLKSSFENLLQALAISEADKNILNALNEIKDPEQREKQLIQLIKDRLKASANWFLIYDNVDKMTDIIPYFSADFKTWGKGKIIITTRDSNIKNNQYVTHSIQIGELTEGEKIKLFSKIFYEGRNSESISQDKLKMFITDIPSFPLDVSSTAFYLKATNLSFEDYLIRLKENYKDFESIQQNLLSEAGEYQKTRYSIITHSLKQLVDIHPGFQDLLLFISLLDSQNIPRDLLDAYKDKSTVDNFIYHLKKYSLIGISPLSSPDTQTFSIHRSTQAITLRYFINKSDLEKTKPYIHQASNILESYLSNAQDKEDLTRMRNIHPHIISFLNHSSILSEKDRANLQSELGYIESYLLQDNVKARKHLEESYLIARQYLDKNDLQLGKVLVYMGIVSRKLGDYEKARNYLEKGLTIYKSHFPEDHPKVREILAHLGNSYRSIGDVKKAKVLLEHALGNKNSSLQQNKAEYARTLTYLGVTYKDLGDYKKSEEFLNQALQVHKAYFSLTHPDTTLILGYLGDTYRKLEEYKKARDVLEEGLTIQKNYFPYNSSRNNWFNFLLGKVYRELGEHQKARTLLETALAYSQESYGKEHIETANIIRSLGQTYFLEGNLDMAENLFQNALKIYQQKNYSDQYIILEDLGELNLKKSQQEEHNGNITLAQNLKESASRNLNKALEIVKVQFPENSTHKNRIQEKLKMLK